MRPSTHGPPFAYFSLGPSWIMSATMLEMSDDPILYFRCSTALRAHWLPCSKFLKYHHSPKFFRSTGRCGGVKTSEPAYSICGDAPGYFFGSGGISAKGF